ncbi:hypothetical protein [Halobacteriovorax sp. HLS]|uniref:hypothetical protein n=1 Tax=Halobacteriovorax sp. HLS TaxID=2234000 RepID=UPI000FD900EF|nr:hypothetical protein [Halobacteriovorax sp. HLS]
MKKISFTFLLVFLSNDVIAKKLRHSRDITLDYNIREVVRRILDVESTCQESCKYHMPAVKEVKILRHEKSEPNSFYIWTHIQSTIDSKYFSKISYVKNEDEIIITQKQVPKDKAKQLEKSSGLKSKPLFDRVKSKYRLHPRGERTFVMYDVELEYSGIFLNLASKKIKNGTLESMNKTLKNLSFVSETNKTFK